MDELNFDKFNEIYANVTEEERELVLEVCNSAFNAIRKNIRLVFDETTKRFRFEKDPLKNYSDNEEDDYDDGDYEEDDDLDDDDANVVEEKEDDVSLSKMSNDDLDQQIKDLTDVASMSCNSQDKSKKHQVELDSLLAERERRLLSLRSC